MKKLYLIALSILFLNIGNSQGTIDFLIDYGPLTCADGTGCVDDPGGQTYDCNVGGTEWFTKTFDDPITSPYVFESITLTGAFACDAQNISVFINGDPVGPAQAFAGDNCAWDCSAPFVVFTSNDLPNYNYGGSNSITISGDNVDAATCLYYFNASITYAAPIPTLSQWGIITLGLLSMVFGIVMIRQRKTIFA